MKNSSEIRNRWFIQQVDRLESRGVTQADISEKMDVSPQYINAIYKGRKTASEKFVLKFADKLNINLEGLSRLIAKSIHEEENTPPVHLNEQVGSYANSGVKIPLVSISAVAGFGNAEFSIQESDVKDYYVVPKFKDRRIDFMIEVSGSSMYPKYSPGDVVACTILKESQFIQWNKVHVIGTSEQGILIKRIKKCSDKDYYTLVSDNKDYDPFEIPAKEITGIAIVVGVIRLE